MKTNPFTMMHPTRRQFLGTLGLGSLAICVGLVPLSASGSGETSRPNIVFILTDDQGYGDAAAFGHPYLKTPNLDRLRREGRWFQNFYCPSAVCTPSSA